MITGEGSFDAARGKLTAGVARHAQRLGIPVAVVAGQTGFPDDLLKEMGIEMQLSLTELAGSIDEAKARLQAFSNCRSRSSGMVGPGGRGGMSRA